MKKYLQIFLAAQMFVIQSHAVDQSDQMFAAFGGRCHSYGSLTQQAQADQLALTDIVNAIKNDPNCNAVKGAVSGLRNLNVNSILEQASDEEDVETLTQNASDLELALAQENALATPDVNYITALKLELSNTKISIVKNKNTARGKKNKTEKLQTIENFNTYSKSILSRIASNDLCFKDKPNLAATLGAQIFALSGTLAGGIVGSLIFSAGEIADQLIGFFRERTSNNDMKPIFEMKLGQAAGCGMEALASTYCKSQDMQTLLKLKNQKEKMSSSQTTTHAGVEIITKDIKEFEDWITALDSGSLATTSGRAIDKKDALDFENSLRKVTQELSAALAEEKKSFAKAEDPEIAITRAVNRLTGLMTVGNYSCSGSNCPTPSKISDLFIIDPSCGPKIYFWSNGTSFGRSKTEQTDSNGNISSNCEPYIEANFPGQPNINNFDKNISDLIFKAQKITSDKSSEVKESNPYLVLAKVEDKAKLFMTNSITYLNSLLEETGGIKEKNNTKDLILSTKQRLEKALDIINKPGGLKAKDSPNDQQSNENKIEAQKKLSELAELLVADDTFLISKAMGEVVRKDLLHKAENGKLDPDLAAMIDLSSSQSLTQLIELSFDLDKARSQISFSKDLSKANLDAFYNRFEVDLVKRIEKLKSDAKDDSEKIYPLAELCMKTIAAPKLSDKIKSVCKGVVLQSSDSKDIAISFDTESGKSFNDRVCSLNNYYRKNFLYRKNLSSIEKIKSKNKVSK